MRLCPPRGLGPATLARAGKATAHDVYVYLADGDGQDVSVQLSSVAENGDLQAASG
jgi:hypothetical protein